MIVERSIVRHSAVEGPAVEVLINGKLVEKVYARKADYQSDCHQRTMHFLGDELDCWSPHCATNGVRLTRRNGARRHG